MADETRNPDRSNTENYGPTRDASQPVRACDSTGSNLYYIYIYIYIYESPAESVNNIPV